MEVFAKYQRTKPTPCKFIDVKRLHYVTRVIHTHEAVEFVYVVSGDADQTFYSKERVQLSCSHVKKGNYYIIEPGVYHSYSDGSDDFQVINIMINKTELGGPDAGKADLDSVIRELFFTSACKVSIPVNKVMFDSDLSVYPIFEKCLRWRNAGRDGLNLYVRAAVSELLCKINSGEAGNGKRCLAEEIRDYIDVNFTSDIALSALSEKFSYSAQYICRVFRKHFGFSYDDYLRKVRMTNAGDLLIGTDMTVERISEIFSYSSAASFRRAFIGYFNMTPGQYRRQFGKK